MAVLLVLSSLSFAQLTDRVLVCGDIGTLKNEYKDYFNAQFGSNPKQVCLIEPVKSEPLYEFNVFGTEYSPNEQGKVFNQLINGSTTIDNAECTTNIYYPNNTLFITNQLMEFVAEGLYVHDFIVPSTLGVYPITMRCEFSVSLTNFTASSQNTVNGTVLGNLSDTYTSNDVYERITEVSNAGGAGGNFTSRLFPIANRTIQWKNAGCASSFQCIDEFPPNNGTDYIFVTSGGGEFANYTIQSASIPAGATITSVEVHGVGLTNGGGSQRFRLRAYHDSEYVSGEFILVQNVWREFVFHITSLEAWQISDFNNGEVAIGINSHSGGSNKNFTSLWLQVNYTTPFTATNFTLDKTFNFTTINTTDALRYRLRVESKWNDTTQNVTMQIFNFTSMQFQNLSQKIPFSSSDKITIEIILDNGTDLIENSNALIRFVTNPNNFKGTLSIDQLLFRKVVQVSDPVEILKGGGELHVSVRAVNLTAINETINISKVISTILVGIEEDILATTSFCSNATELVTSITKTRTSMDTTVTVQENITQICQYGCDQLSFSTARCSPSPLEVNVFFLGLAVLLIIIFAVVLRRRSLF